MADEDFGDLTPAALHLLGDRAWWLPGWLDRLLPDVDVEGQSLERSSTDAAPRPAPRSDLLSSVHSLP